MTTELEQAKQEALEQLSLEEEEMLSKVLFPKTHTENVTLLGQRRKVHPLPIKVARQVHAAMKPVSAKFNDDSDEDFTDELIDSLMDTARVLADFYKWEDVIKALDEESLTNSEIQSLIVAQNEIQGTNDFLLTPLRLAIAMMQLVEVGAVQAGKFKNMSLGQLSANLGDATSNTSSVPTQTDS